MIRFHSLVCTFFVCIFCKDTTVASDVNNSSHSHENKFTSEMINISYIIKVAVVVGIMLNFLLAGFLLNRYTQKKFNAYIMRVYMDRLM